MIYGTEKENHKVLFDSEFYDKNDLIVGVDSYDSNITCKVIAFAKHIDGTYLYRLERMISNDEYEMMINHFKFLRKYNLVV